MSGVKVLLIDDEPAIFEPLSALMAQSGYLLYYASNGHEGIKQFDQIKPDIILLDINMPGMNGMEVCEHIRKKSSVPVIMLSARSEEMDILHGFHVGVDDYLTKPFSFAILQARIKAVLARTKFASQPQPETFISEELAINFERKHVTVGGSSVNLTPTEYRLLEVLSKHAHRTIPVSQLLRDVWGQHYEGEPQYVKQFVWSLRKKIEDNPYEPKHLTTQRGFGYRFD
jgi:DNA-binding response OmpR family regulator